VCLEMPLALYLEFEAAAAPVGTVTAPASGFAHYASVQRACPASSLPHTRVHLLSH
jgi:hypothetical protein